MRLSVNPTRIELTKCKARLKAATGGHKLLKDKSDELVRQFLDYIKILKLARRDIELSLRGGLKQFAIAGSFFINNEEENLLSDVQSNHSVAIATKNIMGVSVPTFVLSKSETKTALPYSLADTPLELDSATINFKSVLVKLIELAQLEKTCTLLSIEIEKTRRRVNALEHFIIPQLVETIAFIQMKLDENERSAIVRLMKVKSNIEGRE